MTLKKLKLNKESLSYKITVVGIGNPLVGDDGAGITVVNLLKERLAKDPRVGFITLEGDLYEIGDYLHQAEQFLFVDAVAGKTPGKIVNCLDLPRAFAPSFHQTDIGSVMRCYHALDYVDPFPGWDIWGITVDPPQEIKPSLSPSITKAVHELVDTLSRVVTEKCSIN